MKKNWPTKLASRGDFAFDFWEDSLAKKVLLDLGAIDFMEQFRIYSQCWLLPLVDLLLASLSHSLDRIPNSSSVCSSRSLSSESENKSLKNEEVLSLQQLEGTLTIKEDTSSMLCTNCQYCEKKDCEVVSSLLQEKETSMLWINRSGVTCLPISSSNKCQLSSGDCSLDGHNSGFGHHSLSLPCINVAETDANFLFHLNVRLRHIHNHEIIEGALRELSSIVLDFHPEAILQDQNMLKSVLNVIGKINDYTLERFAVGFLLSLIRKIKGAFVLSSEPAFQFHPQLGHEADNASSNVKGNEHTRYPGTNFTTNGSAVCPSMINKPILNSSIDTFMQRKKDGDTHANGSIINLRQLMHLITVQLMMLLTDYRQHLGVFAVLHEILPFIKPLNPFSANEVHEQFSLYFHVISDVLSSFDKGCESLGTLCAENVTYAADLRNIAWQCVPVLNILSFAAEMLSLLHPSQVSGILPPKLLKALTMVACDAVVSECNFSFDKRQSISILLHHLQVLPLHEQIKFLPGLPWVDCCAHLPEVGSTADTAIALLLQAVTSLDMANQQRKTLTTSRYSLTTTTWAEIFYILRRLFSVSEWERRNASKKLLELLPHYFQGQGGLPQWLSNSQLHNFEQERETVALIDPFQHCLVPKVDLSYSLAHSSNHGIEDTKCMECVNIQQKPFEDLLGIFHSKTVNENTRKAVVEQIIHLVQDGSMVDALEYDNGFLDALMIEILSWTNQGSHTQLHDANWQAESQYQDNGSCQPSSANFFGHIGGACLRLLVRLVSIQGGSGASSGVREFVKNEPNVYMMPLLPLIFHPIPNIRKELAVFLAFSLFSSDSLLADLKKMSFKSQNFPFSATRRSTGAKPAIVGDLEILVPSVFLPWHLFPCSVIPIDIKSSYERTCKTQKNEPTVQRMVSQLKLLEGGSMGTLELLEKKFSSSNTAVMSLLELQALACLSILNPMVSVKRLLKNLSHPKSYKEELQELEELEIHCSRNPQVAMTLARECWMATFHHFFIETPDSLKEINVMLKVMDYFS